MHVDSLTGLAPRDNNWFTAKAQAWIQAMEGTFPPPPDCGCKVPVSLRQTKRIPALPGPGAGAPLRLAIHQRFELMFNPSNLDGQVTSDVRFFLDLAVEKDGRITGQAVVPREERQATVLTMDGQTMQCSQRNTWTELWEAKGQLDEATSS